MPVIFLKHPKHGGKVAFSETEAQRDESNGWIRFNPGDKVSEPVIEVVPELVAKEPAPIEIPNWLGVAVSPFLEDNLKDEKPAEPKKRGRKPKEK